MKKQLTSYRQRADLLFELVKTNFQLRYNNSVLGILWVLIKPYATFIVLYVIWSRYGGNTIENYRLYLLLGIVFYSYFQELLVFGLNSLSDKYNVILKVNFPRQIAVISSLINAVINLLINLIFVFIIALLSDARLSWQTPLYLTAIAVQIFLFGLGISFFTSIISIRFRDLKNIMDLALFLLYWTSPVFFVLNSDKVGGKISQLLSLNPIGFILNQVRAAFGIQYEMQIEVFTIYLLVTLLIAVMGWYYFNNAVKKIAEYF